MSLFYWLKKSSDHGDQKTSVPVTVEDPLPMRLVPSEDDEPQLVKLQVGQAAVGLANPVPVRINGVMVKASFTRPADTTAYAAGETANNSTSAPRVIQFDRCARTVGGSGWIVGAWLQDSANQSTKGSFELWLFHTTMTLDNDNAAFTPTDAETATVIGIIPFTVSYVGDATSGANGNAVYAGTVDRPIFFVCDTSDDRLYGALVVRNAYTPVSSEQFSFTLLIEQN